MVIQANNIVKKRRIYSDNLVLVPYEKHLVPNYHEWMKDELLCAQTDSIPLTIDEEFIAQENWMKDETKLTFIICDSFIYHKQSNDCSQEERECLSMIGDVNLYFNQNGDDDIGKPYAEISVMIANTKYRRKGYGLEAVLSMLSYSHEIFPELKAIVAIIAKNNIPSLKMFHKKLPFSYFKFLRAFKQHKLMFDFDDYEKFEKFKSLTQYLNNRIENISDLE